MTIKDLVLEKELRLKDVLRAVGVHNSSLWLARLTENIVLLTVPCLLISVLLKVSKKKSQKESVSKHKASTPECSAYLFLICRYNKLQSQHASQLMKMKGVHAQCFGINAIANHDR